MKNEMVERFKRISINPEQCGGWPCIRGMRIRVSDVLDLLAAGLTTEEILDELPDLEKEDIHAVLLKEILTSTLTPTINLLQAGNALVEISDT